MMGDVFWDAATSTAALSAVAVVLAAAFLLAHTPAIVERIWPQAYAYVAVAALVQVLAAALLFFLIGFRIADERAETRQLKNELAWREMELANQKATAEAAQHLKDEAEAAAEKAKGELDDFRTHYADSVAAACAFDADDLERLRKLGTAPGTGAGPRPSALARMRALGRQHP